MNAATAILSTACVAALASGASAQEVPSAPSCREISAEAFNAEPLMAMVHTGVTMKIGEGFEATCAEQNRQQGCLTWRIRGRSLLHSNQTPQRFFEIPTGVVARVTTQPTFRCEAGS